MESLSGTTWDVVISGTGLSQSLLALALSRSGKKVLHVDRNDYYGGNNAAFSLQEAENWVTAVNKESYTSSFRDAQIHTSTGANASSLPDACDSRLGFSRAYSLSLSPELIYTRSPLLPTLTSSKIYRQLEFLAVGSWWIFEKADGVEPVSDVLVGNISRIPGSREDVFTDDTIDLKSKRALTRFLRLAASAEDQQSVLEEWGGRPFPEFLSSKFGIPLKLQAALLALTLSPHLPHDVPTSYALPRVHRHLTSIGVFGPGFSSVIPKWGGLAEIAQVACRAGAVGGGVYVLGRAIESIASESQFDQGIKSAEHDEPVKILKVGLQGGEEVRTHWIAGCRYDLVSNRQVPNQSSTSYMTRTVFIISSSLSSLFPIPAEGSPPPAGAIVVFPTGSLSHTNLPPSTIPPVYLLVHAHETGECPAGQCVIYGSVFLPEPQGAEVIRRAAQALLACIPESPKADVLWSLEYLQRISPYADGLEFEDPVNVLDFPDRGFDLAFEDETLADVGNKWQRISGQLDGFMQFEDRESGAYDDDNDQ